MRKYIPYLVLVIVFIFLFSPDLSAQCSQCKLLADQGGNAIDDKILEHGNRNNINAAILYIMSAPYILLALAAFILRKRIKATFSKMF
ncbi:MAG TPA: hypothetical protein VL021_00060 [Brumimicrobium sp.]|nr:hypothetical protein [Brumimicrobium sp.]